MLAQSDLSRSIFLLSSAKLVIISVDQGCTFWSPLFSASNPVFTLALDD